MYQSIPSLTIPPPQANPQGISFERVKSPPPGTKEVWIPDPQSRKIMLKPHDQNNYFQKSTKNSTEMLIYLEILKQ